MPRLTRSQDAYGQAMWEHFHGQNTPEVVERDDGFIGVSPGAPAYFAEFAAWPEHQRQAIALARGRVLDIGCGAGRVCLHLQERGLRVTGIDVSPLAIRTCRARGVADARVLSITEVSARLGGFDTIVMYGNNFGLFGGPERARRLLRRFERLTTPDARILAETTDPYVTRIPCHLAYHRFNRRRGRLGGQLRLRICHQTLKTPWFDYWLAAKDEMRAMLAGTGWRLVRCFDSPGAAYVAVLEKEKLLRAQ